MPSLKPLFHRFRAVLLNWTAPRPGDAGSREIQPGTGRCPAYFGLVVIFALAYPLAMYWPWIREGGMWAEMSVNYYELAQSPSLLYQFFGLDAGYVPIVQRLLALVGHLLHLPAGVIPFYYTGSALLGTGLLVGVFCLAPFRALIPSDGLRFALCLTALLVLDFETRSFINFTYLGAWPLMAVTALAWTQAPRASLSPGIRESITTPAWIWALLPLALSKPAVLALLPALALAALVSDRRFRRFALSFILLCLVQLVILKVASAHPAAGVVFIDREATLASKLLTVLQYIPGFLGGYLAGPEPDFNNTRRLIFGVVVLTLGLAALVRLRRVTPLVVVGLAVLSANVVLNAFALSRIWTPDMAVLANLPVHRHIVMGFLGTLLLVGQAVQSLTNRLSPRGMSGAAPGLLPPLVFGLWVVATGWLHQGTVNAQLPDAPIVGNSRWLTYAEAIDRNQRPLCVPIDPFGWVYGRECLMLNPEIAGWPRQGFSTAPAVSSLVPLVPEEVPPRAPADHLLALALPIRPAGPEAAQIHMEVQFHHRDGRLTRWDGEARVGSRGGLISSHGPEPVRFQDVARIELLFSEPVQVFQVKSPTDAPAAATRPALLWMGN